MAEAASKTCENCVSAPGSHLCIDCEKYYCENCKLLHNRRKLSRNHQFQKAFDLIPESKSKCIEHEEELMLLCNTCYVPVCIRCVPGNHNGHIFSEFVDAVAKFRRENETKIRTKTTEANQNIKKIENNLRSFDNDVESVIKAINDESNMIKRLVDKSVAQMIALLKEQSKKEKEKLMNMLSDAKSALATGQNLDQRRKGLDKTRQDGTMVQQMQNLEAEINKLRIKSLPEFPKISLSRKSVAEDDIRHLIGTYTISNCSPVFEKEKQRHGNLYRCSVCGQEDIIPFTDE
ncbi:E3 ubiquitin-protein ligase TRIM71-like [Mytilus trossulus]|uniref:E3 ubiquitin-protein ligase TRIM71-like n=1 Tax=Mytilus trossulus TaxID=6551 RepID=UPI003007C510